MESAIQSRRESYQGLRWFRCRYRQLLLGTAKEHSLKIDLITISCKVIKDHAEVRYNEYDHSEIEEATVVLLYMYEYEYEYG